MLKFNQFIFRSKRQTFFVSTLLMKSYSTNKKWKRDFSEFQNSEQMDMVSAKEGEKYYNHFEKGIYTCARCDNELYSSEDKFKSHCRWPSFRKPIRDDAIIEKQDFTYGIERTEILCSQCNLHLGHKFEDGKASGDTHKDARWRHCVLSMSLDFQKK